MQGQLFVGAIDGTHIPIVGTNNICRKGFCFPAIHLQGVCDRYLLFTYVFHRYFVMFMTEQSIEIVHFIVLSRISQVRTIYWEIQIFIEYAKIPIVIMATYQWNEKK